ncbi:MAG: IS110 family transposase [Steroidobacteraceae bacterium]
MATNAGKGKILSLECIERNAAGIDVGATEIYVAVPPDRDPQPVRSFQTFTGDLRAMAAWLVQCRITTVAMESTGVYWIPPHEILEETGIRVCLVNSKHVKHVPGRKSDVSDCQWLQYLHSVGLLRASFRPDSQICAIRSLSRHRGSLIENAAAHVQHMHKALTQMNLQIHHVLSDITGLSGMAIVEAIVAGERDPAKLAALCHGSVRSKPETVVKSLVGNYRSEHLFTLKQSLAAFRHYQKLMAECDQEIERLMRLLNGRIDPPQKGPMPPSPPKVQKRRKNQFYFQMGPELNRIFGVDLTTIPGISALTAHTLLAEIGPDLSRFTNVAAFASWLALSPANKKSGGKVLSSKTRQTNSRASRALRIAAQTLARSRSRLGNFYRSMRARLGGPQAITATAHKLARIIYHLITTGQTYDETVFLIEDQKQAQRYEKRLRKQANALGFQHVPFQA